MLNFRRMQWIGVLFTLLMTMASCAQFGVPSGRGGVLTPAPASASGELVGEIDRMDASTRQIVARTSDGRLETVSFDERTLVMYRGQSYPVTALERGDRVYMRLASTGRPAYVDLISVQQSVQERQGGAAAPRAPAGGTPGPTAAGTLASQRVEGTVGMIDVQRGLFEMQTRDLGTLKVSLPYNPRGPDVERFQRLRSGDFVRLTGRLLNAQRFELEQFL
jgi:hypothetical protein